MAILKQIHVFVWEVTHVHLCTEAKENFRLSELELQVFGGGLDCRMGARFGKTVSMTEL